MRIAIASSGNEVCQHFGHCEVFTLFDLENNQIVKETSLPNPGHQPGFLPGFLKEQGVDLVIAGGMGAKAKELFDANSIKTITGLSGKVNDVIQAFLNGSLVSTNETCSHEHHDGGSCNH